MRKFLFCLFAGALLLLVGLRALLPESLPAQEAMAGSYGYNVLSPDLSLVPETAGSALIAEINTHYLFRTPTAKNEYSGLLDGYNLILICADNWSPDLGDRSTCPAVYSLWRGGIRFTDVYRPDWYQGMDGREFALLTGMVPTNVNGETALLYTGEQDIFLPFSLGCAFTQAGYETLVSFQEAEHLDAYLTMGFPRRIPADPDPLTTLKTTLPLLEASEPFFAYYVWDAADGEAAAAWLLDWLEESGLEKNTAVCLLTGNGETHRAQIFLRAEGLPSAEVSIPCSELDIAPTLLNLFALQYDSRFLSGRDVFAYTGTLSSASAVTPLVSLYGSAYSDWITPAGSYITSECLFWQRQNCFGDSKTLSDYVNAVSQLVYDRYVYARKIMETDYFRLIFEPLAQSDCTIGDFGL